MGLPRARCWRRARPWLPTQPIYPHHQTHHHPPLPLSNLANHSFCGPLPAAWGGVGAFPALERLDVSANHLSGALPQWGGAGGLAQLRNLDLSSNDLRGPLPPAWANLSALRVLRVVHNNLEGRVPPSWGRLGLVALYVRPGNWRMCGRAPPKAGYRLCAARAVGES